MPQITANFSEAECACKGGMCCDNSMPGMDPFLMADVQEMRNILAVPLEVRSGYRCRRHNRAVRGVEDSQHLLAKAIDLAPPLGYSIETMLQVVHSIPRLAAGGIGVYDDFIHVDTGHFRRWDNRTDGV